MEIVIIYSMITFLFKKFKNLKCILINDIHKFFMFSTIEINRRRESLCLAGAWKHVMLTSGSYKLLTQDQTPSADGSGYRECCHYQTKVCGKNSEKEKVKKKKTKPSEV